MCGSWQVSTYKYPYTIVFANGKENLNESGNCCPYTFIPVSTVAAARLEDKAILLADK